MKTTDDMLKDMREALAHHEVEAARLRAGIAALSGAAPAPQIAPWVTPWLPLPPCMTYHGGITITCQGGIPWTAGGVTIVDGSLVCGGPQRPHPEIRYAFGAAQGTYLVASN